MIGALVCFFAALLLLISFLFGFTGLPFNDLNFPTQSRPALELVELVGSSLLIAFGLFFVRDYFSS